MRLSWSVIAASILLGIVWNVIVVSLMGAKLGQAFEAGWLLAGVLAGLAAGAFTIWSRRRLDGRESVLYGILNYYVGLVVYWAGFVVIERIVMCVRQGGWTGFDLHDHLWLILWLLIYGTIWYGVLLIPLCFVCRYLLWKLYLRTEA